LVSLGVVRVGDSEVLAPLESWLLCSLAEEGRLGQEGISNPTGRDAPGTPEGALPETATG
jgi:hypothetical protein